MKAHVGDRIVVYGRNIDQKLRDGEVLEVRGPDGEPPYLVRWDDGHEVLYYPGSDARIVRPEEEEALVGISRAHRSDG